MIGTLWTTKVATLSPSTSCKELLIPGNPVSTLNDYSEHKQDVNISSDFLLCDTITIKDILQYCALKTWQFEDLLKIYFFEGGGKDFVAPTVI